MDRLADLQRQGFMRSAAKVPPVLSDAKWREAIRRDLDKRNRIMWGIATAEELFSHASEQVRYARSCCPSYERGRTLRRAYLEEARRCYDEATRLTVAGLQKMAAARAK